jgi:hypothetical protein
MIAALSAVPCEVVVCACAFPPSDVPKNWKAKRGRPVVAHKDDYRQHYKVERSFAWLGNYRRLLIRWERLFTVYRSWFAVAVLLIHLRRLPDTSESATLAQHLRRGRRCMS